MGRAVFDLSFSVLDVRRPSDKKAESHALSAFFVRF